MKRQGQRATIPWFISIHLLNEIDPALAADMQTLFSAGKLKGTAGVLFYQNDWGNSRGEGSRAKN